MSWQKCPPPVGMLTAIVSPVLVTFSGLPSQSIASYNPEETITLEFPFSEDLEIPSTKGGYLSQSSYSLQSGRTLTALLPNTSFGMTVAANPTFFVYVPRSRIQEAELAVFDEEGNEVYSKKFALTGTPGIVRLSLPPTVSLEIGKYYEWQFCLIFDPVDRSRDLYVSGRIQRTQLSPELKTKLENESDPLEQAKLYAEGKIWHETLTILASLRDSHATEWEGLLASVGLGAIAQAPLVDCCQISN